MQATQMKEERQFTEINLASSINWQQMARPGIFENPDVKNNIENDLTELNTLEETLRSGEKEILGNNDLSSQGQAKELLRIAQKNIKPAVDRLDRRIDGLERGIKSAMTEATKDEKIDPTDMVSELQRREIRDNMKGKSKGEVLALYKAAIDEGDMLTIQAIENAPRSFPLIDPQTLETYKKFRLAQKNPKTVAKMNDWQGALEICHTARKTLAQRLSDVERATLLVTRETGDSKDSKDSEISNYEKIRQYNDNIQQMKNSESVTDE